MRNLVGLGMVFSSYVGCTMPAAAQPVQADSLIVISSAKRDVGCEKIVCIGANAAQARQVRGTAARVVLNFDTSA